MLILVLAAGCASRRQPPEAARREPPPEQPADKAADERWAWATSLVPDLSKLTPRPVAADFSALKVHDGRITVYAPKLTLGMAKTQPSPCLPLPMILEGGALVTRVSLDGRTASPDLADDYEVVRLGVAFDDHDGRMEADDMRYFQSPGRDPLLSDVTSGVIRYDGSPASYVVECATHEDTQICEGRKTVCRWCTPWVVQVPTSPEDGYGDHASSDERQTCERCPPDPVGKDLAKLNQVVSGRSFFEVFPGSGPAFYTSKADCKKAIGVTPGQERDPVFGLFKWRKDRVDEPPPPDNAMKRTGFAHRFIAGSYPDRSYGNERR